MYIQNARITRTEITLEPVLTCYIHIEGDGWGVAFGGYTLDNVPKPGHKDRKATAKGFQALVEIMRVLEVNTWEDLPGRFIRVEWPCEHPLGRQAKAIGHLMKDMWFSFEEFFAEGNIGE